MHGRLFHCVQLPLIITNLTFSRHAKVSPDVTAAPTALLSLDDFEAASKEWEEREDQDDDE
jgi:hypothetical protein